MNAQAQSSNRSSGSTQRAQSAIIRGAKKQSLDQAARQLRRDELPGYLDCIANKLVDQLRAQRTNWAQRFPAFRG